MLSQRLFAVVAALLCLGLGAAFQPRPLSGRLVAVVRMVLGEGVAKSAPEGVEPIVEARAEKREGARAGTPRGVSLHKASGKYVAQISIGGGGKSKNLGSFATPDEAEEEYLAAKSAPEGVEAYIAAKAEKRKAARGDLPKGVYLHEPSGKYQAKISIGGKTKHLGSFATSEEAEEKVRLAKAAPEGVVADNAARAEKRKAARAGLPKGIYLHKESGRYAARIRIGSGKQVHLGLFATRKEAKEKVRLAKSAPEGLEAYIAARAEKRKAARGDLPKGVSLDKALGKYRASISIAGKTKHLGLFATPEEAGKVYLAAKSAPEGLDAYIAARAAAPEKKKAARGDLLPTGVHLDKASGKYLAEIRIGGGKLKYLGYFATSEKAEKEYLAAKSAPEGVAAYISARLQRADQRKAAARDWTDLP